MLYANAYSQDIVRFLFILYKKDPARFEIHIHYADGCSGENDLQDDVYQSIIQLKQGASLGQIDLKLHVCFLERSDFRQMSLNSESHEQYLPPATSSQQIPSEFPSCQHGTSGDAEAIEALVGLRDDRRSAGK